MMNIIIFGPMGAGKTTLANILSGVGYSVKSLGRKIHTECRIHGQETRGQMQQYGQMMRQIFGENVWNDWLFNEFATNQVIDDGRQINEFEYWTEKGYLTVGVLAHADQRRDRILLRTGTIPTFEHMTHDTEMQAIRCAEKCKIKIPNTGTIDDLYATVDRVLIPVIFPEKQEVHRDK